ncbi:MAG: SurA N-terminal domain-containing protein [Pseudomonadota bacterium]
MLSQVRGALKGVVAWIVIVLLILAFALWGVPELRQLTQNSAVSVGGENYTAQFVQNEFNRVVNQRRIESGGQFTQTEAIASGLPDQVISSIATSGALKQLSEKMRLAVPRELVRDFLQSNENFQNRATGQFDQTVLQSILSQNGLTASEFERRIAEDLMRNQLINALSSAGPAPMPVTEAILLRETERRRISYLIVTDEMAGKQVEPTPNDLETYYEQNPAIFTSPEYRTFHLLELRAEDFREGLEVPEEELRRLYELNKPRLYDVPETRTLYQITFDTETDAQAAVAALRQGKPFENIATERGLTLDSVTFSDAQKSAILDPAVADAAFQSDLGEGDVADPVQSLFGWTIVQIAGVNPPETKEYEEVRDELEADFLANDTRRALLNAIDEIEEERDTGATLETAAETAGLIVTTIGPVDRSGLAPDGESVSGVSVEALTEAFRLEEGEETESLELSSRDGYYFVALREITSPALKPYDEVRDEAERLWRNQERTSRISDTIRSIRESVEAGASLEDAAEPFNRAPIELLIDRSFTNEAISESFSDQIFFADQGDLVSGPVALGDAQVVAEIRSVGFARNQVSPNEVNLYRQYIGYQLDQELLEAFLNEVRDGYGVKVNREQLDLIFGELQ